MIFYASFAKAAKEAQLTPAQRCEFYEALLDYVCEGKEPQFESFIMRCLFSAFQINLDNNIKKLAKHRAAVENGKKGAAKRYSKTHCKSDDYLAKNLAKNQKCSSISPSPTSSPSPSPSPSPTSSSTSISSICKPEEDKTEKEEIGDNENRNKRILFPKKSINERNLAFYNSLLPYVDRYGAERIRKFYEYWVEPSQDCTTLRFETETNWNLEARLNRWKD